MSCNLSIMQSSVTELLRKEVGTNNVLFSTYYTSVVNNEDFTPEFKQWCKDQETHEIVLVGGNHDFVWEREEKEKAIKPGDVVSVPFGSKYLCGIVKAVTNEKITLDNYKNSEKERNGRGRWTICHHCAA